MLGAIGYFYNLLPATERAVANYRQYFPTNNLVMINDNGNKDMESIANKFNAKYYYMTPNLGLGENCDDIQVMIQWVERIFTALQHIEEPFFIILEDDVCLLKKPEISHLKGEMNGYNVEAVFPENVTGYIKLFHPHITTASCLNYAGCGGCILYAPLFKYIAQQDWKQELRAYAVLTKRNHPSERSWYFADCCLSFLCLRYGGRIEKNPEWKDIQNHFGEKKAHFENHPTIAILHRYKELYH
jgi:hypothetical protein